ncbi:MAG: hypothetical protein WC383_12465 [Gammaproteobacteria bacterium]
METQRQRGVAGVSPVWAGRKSQPISISPELPKLSSKDHWRQEDIDATQEDDSLNGDKRAPRAAGNQAI